MLIEDAKRERKILEDKIALLIEEYESKTSLQISEIEITEDVGFGRRGSREVRVLVDFNVQPLFKIRTLGERW